MVLAVTMRKWSGSRIQSRPSACPIIPAVTDALTMFGTGSAAAGAAAARGAKAARGAVAGAAGAASGGGRKLLANVVQPTGSGGAWEAPNAIVNDTTSRSTVASPPN